MIYIISHIKPDLDSAVATVALKYLCDVALCLKKPVSKPVLADPANYETKTIFAKFNYQLPPVLTSKAIKPADTFILVDHNEPSQRLNGIKNEQITDIFDHHKFNASFDVPIFITCKPWGATNTIIYWLMKIAHIKPSKSLASLMIAAILSDTTGLKSSTTTDEDKNSIEELNEICQMNNLDAFTLEIFRAKSNIQGLTTKQILLKDFKEYEMNGKKVLINQLETVEQNKLINQNDLLISEILKLKKEKKLNQYYCFITDVLKINSKAIITDKEKAIFKQAFPQAKKIARGVFDVGPIMSRKKEIVPALEKVN